MLVHAVVLSLAACLLWTLQLTHVDQPHESALLPRQMPLDQCICPPQPGNSDLYGLGIRIGIYLQWITAFCANNFYYEEVQSLLTTNTLFLIALCIAGAKLASDGALLQAEYSILIRLTYGFTLTVFTVAYRRVASLKVENHFGLCFTSERIDSWLAMSLRQILSFIIYSFSAWYWIAEAEEPTSSSTCCRTYHFFASRQTATPGFRSLELAIAVILLCMNVAPLLVDWTLVFRYQLSKIDSSAWHQLFRFETLIAAYNERGFATFMGTLLLPTEENEPGHWSIVHKSVVQDALHPSSHVSSRLSRLAKQSGSLILLLFTGEYGLEHVRRRGNIHTRVLKGVGYLSESWRVAPYFNAAYIIWAIVGIELTIKWNALVGVDTIATTGQLIPLVIGLFSVSKSLIGFYAFLVQNRLRYIIWADNSRKRAYMQSESDTKKPSPHIDVIHSRAHFEYGGNKKVRLRANVNFAHESLRRRHSIGAIPQALRIVEQYSWSQSQIVLARRWKEQRDIRPWEAGSTTSWISSPSGRVHAFRNNWQKPPYLGQLPLSHRRRRWSFGAPRGLVRPPFITKDDWVTPRVPDGIYSYPTPKGNIIQFWRRRYLQRSISHVDLKRKPTPEHFSDNVSYEDRERYQYDGGINDFLNESTANYSTIPLLVPFSLALTGPARNVLPREQTPPPSLYDFPTELDPPEPFDYGQEDLEQPDLETSSPEEAESKPHGSQFDAEQARPYEPIAVPWPSSRHHPLGWAATCRLSPMPM